MLTKDGNLINSTHKLSPILIGGMNIRSNCFKMVVFSILILEVVGLKVLIVMDGPLMARFQDHRTLWLKQATLRQHLTDLQCDRCTSQVV